MSADEAEDYHTVQIRTFAETAADMVCAITMNYPEEAIGVARAAAAARIPSAISFTVETDGALPTRIAGGSDRARRRRNLRRPSVLHDQLRPPLPFLRDVADGHEIRRENTGSAGKCLA